MLLRGANNRQENTPAAILQDRAFVADGDGGTVNDYSIAADDLRIFAQRLRHAAHEAGGDNAHRTRHVGVYRRTP